MGGERYSYFSIANVDVRMVVHLFSYNGHCLGESDRSLEAWECEPPFNHASGQAPFRQVLQGVVQLGWRQKEMHVWVGERGGQLAVSDGGDCRRLIPPTRRCCK